ncbi:MAG: hypothetical protein RL557_655, partial [archaeon]
YKSKIDEVLKDYSDENIRSVEKMSRGFSAVINREGFDKMVDDVRIEKINIDRYIKVSLSVSVPFINADDVQDLGYNGTGIKICVIDTGVNASHPALNGKIIDEYCYCDVGTGCPDGTNEDTNAEDGTGHGTHVIGIIASQNSSYKGVAPGSSIYVVRVFDSNGTGSLSDAGQAIDKCILWGTDVITMSLGDNENHPGSSVCPNLIDTQINDAYNVGIPVIASSGNQHYLNGMNYPACAPNVIAVGATAKDDDVFYYSTNRHETLLDLLAPGQNILSLRWNAGQTLTGCAALDSNIMSCSGTSMAAPHVAGAFAQLLQKDSSLTPDQLLTIFNKTGVNVDGWRRINVLAALSSLNQINSTFPSVLYNCTEVGYEQCIGFALGDCNVTLALNNYENVNTIKWGVVNDSADPYVIKNYTFGWKLVKGRDTYYNVINPGENGEDDCNFEDGCAGDDVANTANLSTVNAPGIAFHENIVGYNKTATNSCWAWFNEFTPNYGANNKIYVLNCFDETDCSSENYCDKTGSWPDWHCVQKKGDGQNCTNNFECTSGHCDNDGIGLSDDNICFTSYNTYFDGNEIKFCEYSSGANSSCDEKEIGNGCNSNCNYSVIASSGSYIKHPNGNEKFNLSSIVAINWTLSNDSENDFVRYFIEYSNNSGTNWTSIISNYGYENTFNDSTTQKTLTFSGNENKTVYVRIPKKANVTYARIDLGGLSYG